MIRLRFRHCSICWKRLTELNELAAFAVTEQAPFPDAFLNSWHAAGNLQGSSGYIAAFIGSQ